MTLPGARYQDFTFWNEDATLFTIPWPDGRVGEASLTFATQVIRVESGE